MGCEARPSLNVFISCCCTVGHGPSSVNVVKPFPERSCNHVYLAENFKNIGKQGVLKECRNLLPTCNPAPMPIIRLATLAHIFEITCPRSPSLTKPSSDRDGANIVLAVFYMCRSQASLALKTVN